MRVYKFSSTATETPTMQVENPIQFLKDKFTQGGCAFGIDHLKRDGVYKLSGWIYDFNPFMNTYLVKQYDSWSEYKAPNKTLLRNTIYGRITKIVQIN